MGDAGRGVWLPPGTWEGTGPGSTRPGGSGGRTRPTLSRWPATGLDSGSTRPGGGPAGGARLIASPRWDSSGLVRLGGRSAGGGRVLRATRVGLGVAEVVGMLAWLSRHRRRRPRITGYGSRGSSTRGRRRGSLAGQAGRVGRDRRPAWLGMVGGERPEPVGGLAGGGFGWPSTRRERVPVPEAGMRVGVAGRGPSRPEPVGCVDVPGGLTGQPVGPGARSCGRRRPRVGGLGRRHAGAGRGTTRRVDGGFGIDVHHPGGDEVRAGRTGVQVDRDIGATVRILPSRQEPGLRLGPPGGLTVGIGRLRTHRGRRRR